MNRHLPHRVLVPLLGLSLIAAHIAAEGEAFYETHFASSDDPSGFSFSIGNLDGQGGEGDLPRWLVTAGEASVVAGPDSHSADQHVVQEPESAIRRDNPHAAERVIVRAFRRGAGLATLIPPPPGTSAAGVIAFQDVNGSEYSIHAWDGSVGSYLAPPSGSELSAGEWSEIIMSLNYAPGARHYDVMANGLPLFEKVGFLDSDVESFAGFESATQSGSSLDTVGFHASDGDYDGDGWPDDLEMRLPGGHPLDPAQTPGDVNGDGVVNLLDAVLLGRVAAGAIGPDGLEPIDITQSGSIGEEDAGLLFDYAAGLPIPQPE